MKQFFGILAMGVLVTQTNCGVPRQQGSFSSQISEQGLTIAVANSQQTPIGPVYAVIPCLFVDSIDENTCGLSFVLPELPTSDSQPFMRRAFLNYQENGRAKALAVNVTLERNMISIRTRFFFPSGSNSTALVFEGRISGNSIEPLFPRSGEDIKIFSASSPFDEAGGIRCRVGTSVHEDGSTDAKVITVSNRGACSASKAAIDSIRELEGWRSIRGVEILSVHFDERTSDGKSVASLLISYNFPHSYAVVYTAQVELQKRQDSNWVDASNVIVNKLFPR